MRSVAAVVVLIASVHAGLWIILERPKSAPDFTSPLASVSYSPYSRSQHPDNGDRPTVEQIRTDLRAISPYTRALRTYSSTGGVELVPQVAANFGLKVAVGAWLDQNGKRNEAELRNAVDLAKRNSNVNAIVVGNETTLRADLIYDVDAMREEARVTGTTLAALKAKKDDELAKEANKAGTTLAKYKAEKSAQELVKIIQRVKRQSPVPVTTGETWDVWLDHPELASAVDFLAVHILPYWEGIPDTRVVEQAILIYDRLRAAFPGKRIVIAEFGWPSAGYNFHASNPGRAEQAVVLRDFVTRADAYGIDYNIIEAIDQPWKTNEGGVGAYWGIFDASRNAKFSWTGAVTDPDHRKLAAIAVLIGVLLSLPLLAMTVTITEAGILAAAASLAGTWFAAIFAFWQGHYFVWGAAFALGLGVILLLPLMLIAMSRIEEMAAIAFGRSPRRLVTGPLPAPEGFAPKVSIHIPAHREPPDMLKATLDAVARLDYPNFECVLVINNTPDPSYWLPVEEHCATLGERFKFVNVDGLAGFKAGALRLALEYTAPDAEIIGVIDADYVVRPDWLKDLVPAFDDAKVGLVQAPQDHRDGERSPMHHVMNGEYAGFFDIGMVQRNEANSIIVHGTMCLIRRAAIVSAGGWSSDTIVEDTDLGLGILEQGWQVHYTNRRYGYGLLPDTYEAYQKQRNRWAYGGLQLVKKHWRHMLPWSRRLTHEQKRDFTLGWLTWLGAESLGVAVAILNLIWVPFVAIVGIAIPDKILTIPIFVSFAVSLLHFVVLYRLRVRIPVGQMLGAVFAAMSVQWTVARGVGTGIFKDGLPFLRTAKGGRTRRGADFAAFWEAVLAVLLLGGAALLVMTNYKQIHEINIFAGVLAIQSLPFIAAVGIALFETTRFNDFAYWNKVEAKIGTVVLPAPSVVPEATAQRPAENRVETVQ